VSLQEERRYHALAERIESLTKFAYDAILFLDGQHQVNEANDKALDMYGYSRDELLSLQLKDILSP
jgi:PAS domain S-box-containing protein